MKSSKTPKMIIFSWLTIEKSFVKFFSGSSGISYWSKACSGRSGLSIAPTLDRFGRVQVKNDTIEKKWRTVSQFLPLKKTHKYWDFVLCRRNFLKKVKCFNLEVSNKKKVFKDMLIWARSFFPENNWKNNETTKPPFP